MLGLRLRTGKWEWRLEADKKRTVKRYLNLLSMVLGDL